MAENFVSVGKLGKPHGLSGAFRFLLHRDLKKKILPQHFLLYENGQYLPYFIKRVEWLEWNSGFINFEEITSPEKARLFAGKALFLSGQDAEKFFKPERHEWEFLLGFSVNEQSLGKVGSVVGINKMPAQVLLTVQSDKGEHIIPLVDEFVISVNKPKKNLTLKLPEGLLDL